MTVTEGKDVHGWLVLPKSQCQLGARKGGKIAWLSKPYLNKRLRC